MSTWDFGNKQFKAPARGKGSDRRKMKCRMCKQEIGEKLYVIALKQGDGPINEDKDVARIHVECLPDG